MPVTPVTRANADSAYQALWNELQKVKGKAGTRRRVANQPALRAEMIEHCRAAAALYTSGPFDEYRAAMWERRLWGHEHHRDSVAWDGKDDVVAMRLIRRFEALPREEQEKIRATMTTQSFSRLPGATKGHSEA